VPEVRREVGVGEDDELLAVVACIRQHPSAYVSIRQHTSAYVSIRQHTSAYEVGGGEDDELLAVVACELEIS
jgi:hypothetical protein